MDTSEESQTFEEVRRCRIEKEEHPWRSGRAELALLAPGLPLGAQGHDNGHE